MTEREELKALKRTEAFNSFWHRSKLKRGIERQIDSLKGTSIGFMAKKAYDAMENTDALFREHMPRHADHIIESDPGLSEEHKKHIREDFHHLKEGLEELQETLHSCFEHLVKMKKAEHHSAREAAQIIGRMRLAVKHAFSKLNKEAERTRKDIRTGHRRLHDHRNM